MENDGITVPKEFGKQKDVYTFMINENIVWEVLLFFIVFIISKY